MNATIIVAIIGAVSSFLVALITKYRELIALIEQDNRLRKIPVYKEMLQTIGLWSELSTRKSNGLLHRN
jgi:hypothetical protein